MSLPFGEVNWLAVLVAAIIPMIIGTIWYSPPVFGNTWMRLIGKTADEIESDPTIYVYTFIAALLISATLGLTFAAFGVAAGVRIGVPELAVFKATGSRLCPPFE